MTNRTRENHRFSVSRKFVKFSRKSQAALEFLMTYGWAILVVLVAIGALAYFGVLSPDKFLPAKCTLTSGIACIDHRILATGGAGGFGRVTVRLTNSLGYDIDQICVRAGGTSGVGSVGCGTYPVGASCGASSTETLANGASKTYDIDCATALSGSKFNGQLNVSYRTTDTLISHNNQGQIVTRIE